MKKILAIAANSILRALLKVFTLSIKIQAEEYKFFFLFNYLAYFANHQSGLQQKIFTLQASWHFTFDMEFLFIYSGL